MNLQKQAFTLVELIVVVTILAVLATIGFVSYSGYLAGTRDTNRVSNLKAIYDGLELYRTKHDLPLPEDYVEVKSNGELVAYQGYAGTNLLETIEFSNGGKDPKYENYYSYYLTSDRRYFQLMGYLEEQENLQTDISTKVNAEIPDYSVLYPVVYGRKLGILTDEGNTPIQEVTSIKSAGEIDLNTTDANTKFIAHMEDGKEYAFSGSILDDMIYGFSKPDKYGAPKSCPDGFVGVPGNYTFNQEGFCVAAYEMSYDSSEDIVALGTSGLTSIDSTWNVYTFDDDRDGNLEVGETGYGRKIASRRGGYPIGYITQSEAIDACMSMGDGFHLVTENEWMTMARDFEITGSNWTGGEILSGYIPNGNSNDSSHGCSIDLSNASDPEYTGRRWAAPVGFKSNDSCNETRKYILSNNAYVRDIGGNLREHVNKANTLDGSGYNVGQTSIGTSTSTVQWDDSDVTSGRATHGPLFAQNATLHGIGTVRYPAGVSNNITVRGGCAMCGSHDGIYGFEMGDTGGFTAPNYGFRCAYID